MPDQLAPLLQAARVAAAGGDPNRSVALFREVLAIEADNIAAIVGLGHGLRAIGQADAATRQYRAALAINPSSGAAWWALANMKTVAMGEAERASIAGILAARQVSPINTALLSFTLGKACDDVGDAESAFAAYTSGNAIMADLRPYRDGPDVALFAAIVGQPRQLGIASPTVAARAEQPVPIFIVGMPRSGSTLVEQMLASHPDIGGGGEFSYLADTVVAAADVAMQPIGRQAAALDDATSDAIRRAYLGHWAGQVGSAPIFIDKQLNNFWLIGQIARCFPTSPIIDVQRHPFDACFGAFKQLFAQGQEFTYDFRSYAIYYGLYRKLMAHWKALLPQQIHDVYLEQLVNQPQAVLQPILAQLQLPWAAEILYFHNNSRIVHSASSEQVRTPMVAATGHRFAWHADQMADMRALLADAAADYPFQPKYK